jgi:hypothetical protein
LAVYPFSLLPSEFAEPERTQILWLQMGPPVVTLLAALAGTLGRLDRYIAGGVLLAVAALTGRSTAWWQVLNRTLPLEALGAVLAALAGLGLIYLLRPESTPY